MFKIHSQKTKTGFTLIELLVVIAIIGLFASIIIASLNKARVSARTARRIADLYQIRFALELYYENNNSYPNSGGNWDGYHSCWGDSLLDNWIPGLAPNYISVLPHDPSNSTTACPQ